MNIYVDKLDYNTAPDELKAAFEAHREVESVQVVTDRYAGRSKGFGFFVVPNDEEAQVAIDALNESQLGKQTIIVNKANPRRDNRGGRGGNRVDRLW